MFFNQQRPIGIPQQAARFIAVADNEASTFGCLQNLTKVITSSDALFVCTNMTMANHLGLVWFSYCGQHPHILL